jgi:predicted metal-binding protein
MEKLRSAKSGHGEERERRFHTYVAAAREGGVDHVLVVSASDVVTAPWVRMKCQFGCSNFRKSLCCPPHTPTPGEMRTVLDAYSCGLLLHRHVKTGRQPVDELNELTAGLERMLFLDGYHKAWATGSGPCTRCGECNTGGTCRHAHRARPSMEACGIDVFETARAHGLPIRTLRDRKEERDFFTLILIE